MEINLYKFCGDDPDPKLAWLASPFSIGEWTYATNGYVMVRVPRRPDVPENPQVPAKAPSLFDEVSKRSRRMRYRPAPKFELPATRESRCVSCSGTGKGHYLCPDCRCVCPGCDGEGFIEDGPQKVKIGRVSFNSNYVVWLQELPSLELAQPHKAEPMAFRFDGGEGLLMPMAA